MNDVHIAAARAPGNAMKIVAVTAMQISTRDRRAFDAIGFHAAAQEPNDGSVVGRRWVNFTAQVTDCSQRIA
jgi:hypothetical protein